MAHYLLVYDRAKGHVLRERTFTSRAEALRARFKAEREHSSDGGNVEVVVLSAKSREDLLRTHSRYFLTLAELAGKMG
jgi:hypothetical protein